MNKINSIIIFIGVLSIYGCGFLNLNYLDEDVFKIINIEDKNFEKRFYFIGDVGVVDFEESSEVLVVFNVLIENEDIVSDYFIFFGDNIYLKGFLVKGEKGRE